MNILKELENTSQQIDNWYGGLDEARDETMNWIMDFAKEYHKEQIKRTSEPATAKDTSKKSTELIDGGGESCIEFAIWLQDNYSQNRKQGGKEMLPKGYMREDFTDNIFPISEIWRTFNSR